MGALFTQQWQNESIQHYDNNSINQFYHNTSWFTKRAHDKDDADNNNDDDDDATDDDDDDGVEEGDECDDRDNF